VSDLCPTAMLNRHVKLAIHTKIIIIYYRLATKKSQEKVKQWSTKSWQETVIYTHPAVRLGSEQIRADLNRPERIQVDPS